MKLKLRSRTRPPDRAPSPSRALTVAEVAVGVAVVSVAVLAEVSLALAHLRRYSFTATGLISGVVLVGLALAAWRLWAPQITLAPARAVAVVGVTAVGAFLVLPGFPSAMAGWDPGVYLNHGFSIARTGDYDLPDPVLAYDSALPMVSDRFPGTDESERDADRSVVGFYHLYPALLAPATAIAGERAAVNVNPILGLLTLACTLLVAWRVFGAVAGALAGLLSAVNMVAVWHARYPTSEALTQLLLVAAMLGIVLAIQTRSRVPAAVAGVLVGLVYLSRADGLLVVFLAALALVALAALGRFDRRCGWFAAGLGATLPHGLLQAGLFAGSYTRGQGLPSVRAVVASLVALVIIAGVLTLARRTELGHLGDRVLAWLGSLRGHRAAAGTIVAGWTVVLLVGYLRPVFAPQVLAAGAGPSEIDAFYDVRSLVRLTWFLTPLGVAALWVAVVVVARRRWQLAAWVLVIPTLVFLPVYLADARISNRLIWWTRRFVPYTLTGMMILVAVALAAGLTYRGRWIRIVRLVSGAATVAIVLSYLSMSLPLRQHNELDGSFAIYHQVAALAEGKPAVYLWSTAAGPATGPADAFGSTVLYRNGFPSAQIPPDATGADLQTFADAFPDREVLVVVNGSELPEPLLDEDLQNIAHVQRDLPLWEITFDRRPTQASQMTFDFTVWRLRP